MAFTIFGHGEYHCCKTIYSFKHSLWCCMHLTHDTLLIYTETSLLTLFLGKLLARFKDTAHVNYFLKTFWYSKIRDTWETSTPFTPIQHCVRFCHSTCNTIIKFFFRKSLYILFPKDLNFRDNLSVTCI